MKAYWITFYRSISDPDALAAYAALAVPAIEAGGGRILARGLAAHAFEGGLRERTVLVESWSKPGFQECPVPLLAVATGHDH